MPDIQAFMEDSLCMEEGCKGLLVVLSGPSGVGKGTVCRRLIAENPNMALSISATTRQRRETEQDGKDYFFKSKEEFARMIQEGEFLEYMRVFGTDSYGTPRKFVMDKLDAGEDVILEIDVQGGLRVKEVCTEAVLVFMAPPSMDELKRRLIDRGTETEQSIAKRTEVAYTEMQCISYYDYVVINSTVEQAVRGIEAIVHAEKSRVARCEDLINLLLEGSDAL